MRAISVLLALAAALLGGTASAQSGDQLLASKGCLGCHGIDEKGMGPALKSTVAKYKGTETKLIAVLKEGKGHPIKVDATDAPRPGPRRRSLPPCPRRTQPPWTRPSASAATATKALRWRDRMASRARCTWCRTGSSTACTASASAWNATRTSRRSRTGRASLTR
jgi:cytochrome c551/c552